MIRHNPDIWNRAMALLAERNESVEVRPVPTADTLGRTQTSRLRVLALQPDGTTLLERPAVGGDPAIRPGAQLRLFLLVDAQRWQAVSHVVEATSFQLNSERTVRAWRLSPASQVTSGQRRSFYRADAAALTTRPVRLVPLVALEEPPDPERLPVLEAKLVNISGGGVGLTLPLTPALAKLFKTVRRYVCQIFLPHIEETLESPAELVHVHRLSPELVYLGLTFEPENEAHRRHLEDQIVRFATWVQREQIRRERRQA